MEIIDRFQNLRAHERINTMCDLLNCCNTLELNFYVTYLAGNLLLGESFISAKYKASYRCFSNLTSVYHPVSRRELITTVVLMSADNYSQAHDICAVVNAELNDGSDRYLFVEDQGVIEEILLLVTLIVNHPAFKYIHVLTFVDCLTKLRQEYELRNGNLQSPKISNVDAVKAEDVISTPIPVNKQISEETVIDKPNSSTLPVISPKITKQEQILGVKCRKVAKKRMFVIELTWTSLKRTVVRKTFQDITNFHRSLLQQYPDICFFASAVDILNCSTQQQSEAIEKFFTRFFVEAPLSIQNDADIVQFFTSPAKRQPPSLVGISNLSLDSSGKSVNGPSSSSSSDSQNGKFDSRTSSSDATATSASQDFPIVSSRRKSRHTTNRKSLISISSQNEKHIEPPMARNGRKNHKITNYTQLPEVKVIIRSENKVEENVVTHKDEANQPSPAHQDIRPAETQVKNEWPECNWKKWNSIKNGTTFHCGANQNAIPRISYGLVSTVAEMFVPVSYSQVGRANHMLNGFRGCNINDQGVKGVSPKGKSLLENKKCGEEAKPNKDHKFSNVHEIVPFKGRPAFSPRIAGYS